MFIRSTAESERFLNFNFQQMASNGKSGDNRRIGAVKERTQVFNPHNQKFVKRDSGTGRFMDMKSDGNKFKGVSNESKTKGGKNER